MKNLQDHVISYVGPFIYDKSKTSLPDLNSELHEDALHEYLVNGTGKHKFLKYQQE